MAEYPRRIIQVDTCIIKRDGNGRLGRDAAAGNCRELSGKYFNLVTPGYTAAYLVL